jgi:hypothetical protein
MRQHEELRRIPRDAERLAHRFDGLIPPHVLAAQVRDELLAAQSPDRLRPVSDQVPVHDSAPPDRSSGLFRDPNISACRPVQSACRP